MAYLTLVQGIPFSLFKTSPTPYSRHPFPPKGGRKVEGKISLPPLKSPLFKGDFSDLVEVEVKIKKKKFERKL